MIFVLYIFCFIGCSVKKVAIDLIGSALSKEKGSSVFSSDDDPKLIGDALPFAIKLYESLAANSPKNPQLLLATGKAICMYTYAYIQLPAEQLSYSNLEEKEKSLKRAKRLYLRARDYIIRAISLKHSDFVYYIKKNDINSALRKTSPKDTSYLYWLAISWMAAFTCDKSDIELMVDIPKSVAFVHKVLEFNPKYNYGSAHEFFISYYGSMPEAMGGNENKAREHFAKAIECSQGKKASPYIALATSVCVKNQNYNEFKSLLQTALNINPDIDPENRLLNIISQQKAKWLLDHAEDMFISQERDTLP